MWVSEITEDNLSDEVIGRLLFEGINDAGEKVATATAFYDIYGRDKSGAGWLHHKQLHGLPVKSIWTLDLRL